MLRFCLDLLHGAGTVFFLRGHDSRPSRKRGIEILVGGSLDDGLAFSQLPIDLGSVISPHIFQQLRIDLDNRQFIHRILVVLLHLNSIEQISDQTYLVPR